MGEKYLGKHLIWQEEKSVHCTVTAETPAKARRRILPCRGLAGVLSETVLGPSCMLLDGSLQRLGFHICKMELRDDLRSVLRGSKMNSCVEGLCKA